MSESEAQAQKSTIQAAEFLVVDDDDIIRENSNTIDIWNNFVKFSKIDESTAV